MFLLNLLYLPGSVGASPIQNIGAYGADVSKLIDSVDCFCLDTFSKKKLTNKECTFAYRDSAIKNSQYLIYNINFKTNLNKNISYKNSKLEIIDCLYRYALFGLGLLDIQILEFKCKHLL